MKGGIWHWPSEPRQQALVLRKVASSPELSSVLKAISKSREGLSNPEVDEILGTNSQWLTIWVLRQLLSLGFVDYKVDYFGEPSRYTATELGQTVLQKLTGKPLQPKPSSPAVPQSQTQPRPQPAASSSQAQPKPPSVPPTQ